jgi:hypothetical protein
MTDIILDHWRHKHNSKLTDAQVRKIRLAFKSNPMTRVEILAKNYKVSIAVIQNIKAGRTFRHII